MARLEVSTSGNTVPSDEDLMCQLLKAMDSLDPSSEHDLAAMSAAADPASKRGTVAGSTTDIDTIIPLLFAANPGITPNYKKMSAMDSHGRTASAMEHKFRKWRALGRDILAAHPEEMNTDKAVGEPAKTKRPRTPKTENGHKKTSGRDVDDQEDVETKAKTNGKKRPASAKADDVSSPTKKQKAQKKGMAQKVKKQPAANGRAARSAKGEASAQEDDSGGDGAVVQKEDVDGLEDEDEDLDEEDGNGGMVFEAAA